MSQDLSVTYVFLAFGHPDEEPKEYSIVKPEAVLCAVGKISRQSEMHRSNRVLREEEACSVQSGSGGLGENESRLPASKASCLSKSSSHTKVDVAHGDCVAVSLVQTLKVKVLMLDACMTIGPILSNMFVSKKITNQLFFCVGGLLQNVRFERSEIECIISVCAGRGVRNIY